MAEMPGVFEPSKKRLRPKCWPGMVKTGTKLFWLPRSVKSCAPSSVMSTEVSAALSSGAAGSLPAITPRTHTGSVRVFQIWPSAAVPLACAEKKLIEVTRGGADTAAIGYEATRASRLQSNAFMEGLHGMDEGVRPCRGSFYLAPRRCAATMRLARGGRKRNIPYCGSGAPACPKA